MANQEVVVTIIACIGLFVLLCAAIIRFPFLYEKKKKRHERELEEMQKKYEQETLRSQLEAQEQTRIYIARELHDNIGTLSSLVKINLNLIDTTDSEEKKKEWIEESKEIVKKLITEVKQLSLDLNTDRLQTVGLVQMLQQDVQRMQRLNLFLIKMSTEGEERKLSPDQQIILYRICQELMHNIIKHSGAKNVSVSVVYEPARLYITISDDGVGFDIKATGNRKKEKQGSGLTNLRNRIQLIGGKLVMKSFPGSGVICYIDVPFSKN
jgi:signal transduction histidine kinase